MLSVNGAINGDVCAVWSRRMVNRVPNKDARIFLLFRTNEFVGREPLKTLKPFGKVISL